MRLPLHTDLHTLWEFVGNNLGFINFYIPIVKKHANASNLRLLPYDRLNPSLASSLSGSGGRTYSPADRTGQCTETTMSSCAPRRALTLPSLDEPFTHAGDLLVIRGDVPHESAKPPRRAFRLALSIRAWPHLPSAADLSKVLDASPPVCKKRVQLIRQALKQPSLDCTAFRLESRA